MRRKKNSSAQAEISAFRSGGRRDRDRGELKLELGTHEKLERGPSPNQQDDELRATWRIDTGRPAPCVGL
jgi:hypothetical protein